MAPLTLLTWAYWLAVLGALVGVGVLARGWRARRLDDHPICRRCKYDLFGLGSDQPACPECGADVRRRGAVTLGNRARHKPMIYSGLAMALLFASGAYLADWRYTVIHDRPWQFVQAVQQGDLPEVDRLLTLHPEFARGQYYTNLSSSHQPVHAAIVFASSDPVLQRLLAEGVDPNVPTRDGDTALQLAAERMRASAVAILLAAGADPNLPGKDGQLPLHVAIKTRYLPLVQDLLQGGARLDAVDAEGRTALHVAAAAGGPRLIEALLAAGADVHARDAQGRTPLHIAMAPHRGSRDISLLLLDHGADLVARDQHGHTPGTPFPEIRYGSPPRQEMVVSVWWRQLQRDALDEAAAWLEAAPEVLTADAGYTPATLLHRAVREGEVELVRLLLDHGADPNLAGQQEGRTALHELVWARSVHDQNVRPPLLELLLEAGADVHARDDEGRTALHLAAGWRSAGVMIPRLLEKGAKVDALDDAGSPPLHYAAFQTHMNEATVDLLREHGAELDLYTATALNEQALVASLLAKAPSQVNARDNHPGRTPLHIAAHFGHVELADYLLENGAHVNVLETNHPLRRTPLHIALSYNEPAVVRRLVEARADLTARDAHGRTPLHQAAGRDADLVAFLLEHGADINAENNRGQTPLDLAQQFTNQSVTELLERRGAQPGDG
ncbi:MAG: ankyrin repeat domain-containing protein [Phycisphaeraceae bacterium]